MGIKDCIVFSVRPFRLKALKKSVSDWESPSAGKKSNFFDENETDDDEEYDQLTSTTPVR
jgi:hypothetical protein